MDGTKEQREKLKQKFGGRCGYCGDVLTNMHADHIKPVIRVTTDHMGRPLNSGECYMVRPELNNVEI